MADNAAKTKRTTPAARGPSGRSAADDAQGLRTFRASTMAEALSEVKKTLGSDAVILRTRSTKVGGVLGVGAKSVVEITASADPDVAAVASPRRPRPTRQSADAPAAAARSAAPSQRRDVPEPVDIVELRSPERRAMPPAITRPSAARALLSKDEPIATAVSPAPVDQRAVHQLEDEMRAMRSMMAE
ncbi:MAG: hypothetical protein AAF078_10125, partial [Planctomycetota bacterium]